MFVYILSAKKLINRILVMMKLQILRSIIMVLWQSTTIMKITTYKLVAAIELYGRL